MAFTELPSSSSSSVEGSITIAIGTGEDESRTGFGTDMSRESKVWFGVVEIGVGISLKTLMFLAMLHIFEIPCRIEISFIP